MNEQALATCDPHDSVSQIEQLVLRRLSGRACSLKLTVRDNGLVLRGHARTYYAKQLAQHAVMESTKLRIWANEIEVAQVPRTVPASDELRSHQLAIRTRQNHEQLNTDRRRRPGTT